MVLSYVGSPDSTLSTYKLCRPEKQSTLYSVDTVQFLWASVD